MGTQRVDNLHVMGVCVNCGGALEDRWKFCIFCGTPVSRAPISEPAAEPARGPDAELDAEQPFSHPGGEPDISPPIDDGPNWEPEPEPEPEPSRPPIPAAIRTFVQVEIPNEDEDDPAARHIRPRFRPRRVDIPLLLGIALGIAGFALIIYMIAVLSGQG
ncbi:hypothetical protein GCM10027057_10230 [Marisediminicola antarctica]